VSRTTTLVGYGVIAAALVACHLTNLVSGRIPPIGQAVSVLVRRRPARWLLLTGWLWLGWHLFVRSHAGA
jgi:hypothetical protein